jgi:hypothetical protein
MPQSKILVDTNAYIRMAKTIHPLLFVPFGDSEHCLYVLPELNSELSSHKLQSKFHWVNEEEFVSNRKHFPSISKKQNKSIQQTFDYLWDHVQTELPGPSKVDTLYIAYSLELDVPVITDDQDMTELANAFEAQILSTLEMLKIMLECDHIDMKIIDGLCDYWRYLPDLPANFKSDYQRLFSDQID